jgi:hypothetical protein
MKTTRLNAPKRQLYRPAPLSAFSLKKSCILRGNLLGILALVLVSPVMAATPNGIAYKVRQPDGADQYYQIVVPASVDPAPFNPRTWTTPSMATKKFSAQAVGIAAVAWAGGLSKSAKTGPTNSPVDVGGPKPGGFYDASSVRIDSVQFQNDPMPYYIVRMTGQVGASRQVLYAAVLEDGRIIRPIPVSGPSRAVHSKVRHHSMR